MAIAEDKTTEAEEGIMAIPGAKDSIDNTTFEQILEMDDDDGERDFSQSIVYDFFAQADGTFGDMEKALDDKDLKKLSELGHFLKGSSATLGLTKVKNSCEKIQHYGEKKNETGTTKIEDKEALDLLERTIKQAKEEFDEVKTVLEKFYEAEATK